MISSEHLQAGVEAAVLLGGEALTLPAASNGHGGASSPSDQSTGSGGGGHPGAGRGSPAPNTHQYTAEYLAQLLKDKKQLSAFPNVFLHLERLVDEEISKVRVSLFQFEFTKEALSLPDAVGTVTTQQEKVYVPVKEFPDYNFVGRILGPRGMTAKQLEQETGCKIMVRGRGSMRDKKKEEQNRGKPNWEHLSDDLHVLIQCEDTENRSRVKLARAVEEIQKLLVPAAEGEDELKRKQLMELAIINGTYRPANSTASEAPRLLTPMTLSSPLRSPTLGAPIILSPTRSSATAAGPAAPSLSSLASSGLNGNSAAVAAAALATQFPGLAASFPGSPTDIANSGLLLGSAIDPGLAAAAAAGYPYAAAMSALSSPLFASEYPALDPTQAGALLSQRRLLGQARDHPYQRASLKTPQ